MGLLLFLELAGNVGVGLEDNCCYVFLQRSFVVAMPTAARGLLPSGRRLPSKFHGNVVAPDRAVRLR